MTKPEIIAALEERIRDNCKIFNLDEAYDDMLDECFSFDKVGGIFEHMSPSKVLETMDPTAYRCGKVDYEDSLGLVEVDGEYYNHDDAEKAREELTDEWESEVSDLQDELGDDDELEPDEATKHRARIAELNEAIKVATAHAL